MSYGVARVVVDFVRLDIEDAVCRVLVVEASVDCAICNV